MQRVKRQKNRYTTRRRRYAMLIQVAHPPLTNVVSIIMLLLIPIMPNTNIQNSSLSCNVRHVNVL
jgi:hypothetical protein